MRTIFFYGEPIEIPYRTKGLSHGPATSFQCEDLAELAHQLPDRLGEGYEAERFGGDSLLIWADITRGLLPHPAANRRKSGLPL